MSVVTHGMHSGLSATGASESQQSPSVLPPGTRKCHRCNFVGPEDAFPLKKNGSGHMLCCSPCTDKEIARARSRGLKPQLPTTTLEGCLRYVSDHKNEPFEFDSFVEIPQGTWLPVDNPHTRANKLRELLSAASEYRWNQKKTRKAAASHVVTYYCAQIEGEQTKRKPTTRTRMKRYHCAGWLHITIMNSRDQLTRIRMTHSEAHPHYVDTKEVEMVKLSDHNDANDAFSDMGGHQMGGIISDEGDHDADMHTVEEAGPGSSAGEDYPWEHMGYDAGGGYGGEGSLYQEPPAGDSLTRGANEPYVALQDAQRDVASQNFEYLLEISKGPVSPDEARSLAIVFDTVNRAGNDISTARDSKRSRLLEPLRFTSSNTFA